MQASRTGRANRSSRTKASEAGEYVRIEPELAWLNRLLPGFGTGDREARKTAASQFVREMANAPDDSLTARKLEAFQAQLSDGTLRNVPEAHLAMAEVLLRRGDEAGARRELHAATQAAARLACGDGREARAMASDVNREAASLHARMGDGEMAQWRLRISRLYCAQEGHRSLRLPVRKAPPGPSESEYSTKREPSMSSPQRRVPVPLEMQPYLDPPQSPPGRPGRMPGWRERPIPGLGAFDLFMTAAAFASAMIRMKATANYINALRSEEGRQRTYAVPPHPSFVEEAREATQRLLTSGGMEERQAARELLDSGFYDYVEEASRAYWGNHRLRGQ